MIIDKKKKTLICATIFGANVFVINSLEKVDESKDLLDDNLSNKIKELNNLYGSFATMSKENGVTEELFRSGCLKMSKNILSSSSGLDSVIKHIDSASQSFSTMATDIIKEISESKTGSNHKSKTLQKAISALDSFVTDLKNKIN